MHVVVAHGREGERRRFREVLAEAGHEVTECGSAGDALDCCLDLRPDVAVIDEPPDELLRRADEALYAAKARGRDCLVGAPARLARRK
jgi:PleD family two-component response regulator